MGGEKGRGQRRERRARNVKESEGKGREGKDIPVV